MHIFSRKASKEAALQRIYTEAYQSSLQSILKESSFEFRQALDAWRETLSNITAGMGQMDGSPPRTTQEMSLLNSIRDIERQCNERIASLEQRLNKARISAGIVTPGSAPANVPTASTAPDSVPTAATQQAPAANVKSAYPSPQPQQNVTRTVQTDAPPVLPPSNTQSPSASPSFDFTERFPSSIPKARDMPYGLYTKKPAVAPIKTDFFPPTKTSLNSPPTVSPSTLMPRKSSEPQFKQPRKQLPSQSAAPTVPTEGVANLSVSNPSSGTPSPTVPQPPAHTSFPAAKAPPIPKAQPVQSPAQSPVLPPQQQQQQQQTHTVQHAQSAASLASTHERKKSELQEKAEAQAHANVQQAQQQKGQKVVHRSSLDYPQPAPAQHSHSLLHTLRNKNPLKSRSAKAAAVYSQNSAQARSESIKREEEARKSAALSAAKQTVQQTSGNTSRPVSGYQQFSGFDGSFVSDNQPSSPTMSSPTESFSESHSSHKQQQQHHHHHHHQPQYQQHIQPLPTKKSQFQVTYDKVSTVTGRTIYRPRVVRTPVNAPSQPVHSRNSSLNNNSSRSSQSVQQSSQREQPSQREQQSQRQESKPKRILADGSSEGRSGSEELEEMDEWDRMVQEKIKELRGVDKNAAQQIVNEVVLKGDKVQWDDIAGLEKAKASLKETVVYPFLRPDLFMGLREPVLGMLLFGPPGTGKTMLARAVATESKSTFFSISASSLTSKYMGESEKLVRALFQLAKALAPSIIFVDEIDSILTQRADSGEHEASRRIKNEFLVQWSDLQAAAAGKADPDSNVRRVLVLGATNLPWAIDEAARRRFVRRQYIPLPEPYTRQVHLLKLLSHQKHALTEADLMELVKRTEGYSGSDLTALAKDAAMGPLRSLGDALLTTAPDQIRPMGMSDFIESMRSIRPSVSTEGLRAFEQWAEMYGSSGA